MNAARKIVYEYELTGWALLLVWKQSAREIL